MTCLAAPVCENLQAHCTAARHCCLRVRIARTDSTEPAWRSPLTDPEIQARLDTLEAHVAKLEGVLDVLLQEIAAGTAEEMAEAIRAELRKPSV